MTQISLPVFPSRTNMELHNIPVTSKMVKQLITNLNLPKVSGPDCIPVVVLKNFELELSYILVELFNKCLKESCFPNRRFHWWFLYLRMLGKGLQLKTTALLVFFLWLVVFEKLVNNRIVDHLEPCGLFCDFLYGFMSSQSTADLLTVVSDRIATQAAALDIFKAFNRV